MADRYQTQCPHCGVKFQITAQQLQLANGTVRCGSCLQVFQANQNLVPLTDGAPPAAAGGSARPSARPPAATPADVRATVQRPAISVPPRPTAPTRPTSPAPADEDLADQILRELETPAGRPTVAKAPTAVPPKAPPKAPPKTPAATTPPKAATPPATPKAPAAPSWTPPAQPKTAAPADKGGWAPPPQHRAAPAKPPAPSNASRHGIHENRIDNIQLGTRQQMEGKFVVDDPFGVESSAMDDKDFRPEEDESWAKDLIGEKPLDEREERLRKFQISSGDLSLSDPTGVQHTSGLAARIQRMADDAAGDMPSPIRRTAPAGGSQVDDEFDFLSDPGLTMQDVDLPGIDDSGDHLLAAAQAHQVRWGSDIFWGTLSAVFLLALLGQYMAAHIDTLARDPAWRGMYEVACGAVGCALPGDSDVRRIQGANLVVRSHPAAGNALVVDAVIYNRASFEQPFPRIELAFSDTQGTPVAGRVFAPEEYLKGELAETRVMPVDTPIHLSLEILDPGPDAVNYELRFLPTPVK